MIEESKQGGMNLHQIRIQTPHEELEFMGNSDDGEWRWWHHHSDVTATVMMVMMISGVVVVVMMVGGSDGRC